MSSQVLVMLIILKISVMMTPNVALAHPLQFRDHIMYTVLSEQTPSRAHLQCKHYHLHRDV